MSDFCITLVLKPVTSALRHAHFDKLNATQRPQALHTSFSLVNSLIFETTKALNSNILFQTQTLYINNR